MSLHSRPAKQPGTKIGRSDALATISQAYVYFTEILF